MGKKARNLGGVKKIKSLLGRWQSKITSTAPKSENALMKLKASRALGSAKYSTER